MNHAPRTLSPGRRLGAALALLALFLSPLRAEELSITIQCSPATVALHAVRSGDWLTVHADIPYRLVAPPSVKLVAPPSVKLVAPKDVLDASATFADDRGDLVAKFKMSDLKALLDQGTSELTLTGCTVNGVEFAGTSTVRVVK
jgi:hypothetical protein